MNERDKEIVRKISNPIKKEDLPPNMRGRDKDSIFIKEFLEREKMEEEGLTEAEIDNLLDGQVDEQADETYNAYYQGDRSYEKSIKKEAIKKLEKKYLCIAPKDYGSWPDGIKLSWLKAMEREYIK